MSNDTQVLLWILAIGLVIAAYVGFLYITTGFEGGDTEYCCVEGYGCASNWCDDLQRQEDTAGDRHGW